MGMGILVSFNHREKFQDREIKIEVVEKKEDESESDLNAFGG